jgi:heptosyltransferase II
MKIGIFLPNWLGDLVMATPALRAVRRHFGPQARIVGIMRPNLTGLLAGTNWLSEEWRFDPNGNQRQWRRWALIRRMRQERFDIVLLLTNSLDAGLLTWLSGAKRRVGDVRRGRGPLLTDKRYPRRSGRHILPAPMVENYLALAEAIGCLSESPRLELATTDSEERVGEQIWRTLGLRTDGRVLALNCSGAYGAAKRWPLEHCGTLAGRVAAELDHDVLVICGPGESNVAREIVGHAQSRHVFSLADQPLGLTSTKACLRRCRLLVSTDSGPRHVAAALGKPVITLLGPTSPVWIENPTVRGSFVHLDLDCLGCAKRVCPLGHHRCMKELTPDMVLRTVIDVLNQEEAMPASPRCDQLRGATDRSVASRDGTGCCR